MFSFSKPKFLQKKPPKAPVSSAVYHAMRTMEDDLSGAPLSENTDKVATFSPHSEPGVAFFNAEKSGDSAPLTPQTESAIPASSSASQSVVSPATSSPTSKGQAPTNLPFSPFLTEGPVSGTSQPAPQMADLPLTAHVPYEKKEESPSVGTIKLQSKNGFKKFLLGLLLLLFLLAAGALAYFYFVKKTPLSEIPSILSISTITPEKPVASVNNTEKIPPQKFSADQANLLSVSTETVTAADIRTLFLETAQEVKDENLPGAVEFLIRDQNYNPLAFSRFAYLADLKFPADLLNAVDESFSLYMYIDGGRPHTGLLLTLKNRGDFEAKLTQAEKTLPQAVSPLFIDTTSAPKTGLLFKKGAYEAIPTRYTNVDPSINLSVDYAFRDSQWILGTSRDTLRAILSKEKKETFSPAPMSSPSEKPPTRTAPIDTSLPPR